MARSSGKSVIFANVLVGMISISLAAAQTPSRVTTTRDAAAQTVADLSSTLEATSRLVGPSVVEIFTTSYKPGSGVVPRSADLLASERGSGSGVIVDPDGYIVTNAHVVRGAQSLRVEIPITPIGQSILATSTRTVRGEIVGIDLETDLAVVKVNEHKLPAVPFADSDTLKAGQLVFAF